MKKSFASLLLVFAFSSPAFCQISGQQPLVSIESLPVPDSLPKETPSTVKREPVSLRKMDMDLEKPQGVNRQGGEPPERVWVSGEFLLWKMRGSNLPPLITVASDNRFVAELDEPNTVITFGGRRLDQGRFPGARFTAGLWLNERKTVGAEVSYFFMKKKTFRYQANSSGLPGALTISRPFIFVDLSTPGRISTFEAAFPIATPYNFVNFGPTSVFSGTGTGTFSGRMQGAEASMLYRPSIMRCCRVMLLAGFRYLDLNEALTVTEFRDLRSVIPGPSQGSLTDQFNTRNQFYGGQVGLRSTLIKGRLSLELSGTIALGNNHEIVNIRGFRTDGTNQEGPVQEGLLAISTNIGRYSRNRLAYIPEVRANLGFALTNAIRPFIGYQYLYWNSVVMPGEQIDRYVNFLFLVGSGTGPRRPAFSFRETTFWAQGLTTGMRVQF